MKLTQLQASRYRSLRDVRVAFGSLNVFIGANAAGKSNILDALRFLATGIREKDFAIAVNGRGGILALAWKGEPATEVRLTTSFSIDPRNFEWSVNLRTWGYGDGFDVEERVTATQHAGPPMELLWSRAGEGWWWSEDAKTKVPLAQSPTACGLAAAAADASFPARGVAEFAGGWGFFDPSPPNLRRSAARTDSARLDPFGRNLAARLRALKDSSPAAFQSILVAMRNVLGVPEDIELRETEDGQVFFLQKEPGLTYRVHQIGASSGTLRMLALMTALFGESQAGLVGIEEPENHVHPLALRDFAEHVRKASERIQVVLTTHSPLLLDYLDDPGVMFVVRRTEGGTDVIREENAEAVREALVQSGFALGEYLQTKGFGS